MSGKLLLFLLLLSMLMLSILVQLVSFQKNRLLVLIELVDFDPGVVGNVYVAEVIFVVVVVVVVAYELAAAMLLSLVGINACYSPGKP